jgi:hypothetical protein
MLKVKTPKYGRVKRELEKREPKLVSSPQPASQPSNLSFMFLFGFYQEG